MKKITLFIIGIIAFSLFITGCAQEEDLPPPPPPPGGDQIVGKAAGIAIPAAQRPSWASAPNLVEIDPVEVEFGESVRMIVGDVYANNNYDYIWTVGYVLNKNLRYWEPIYASTALSGAITEKWAKDQAQFILPINEQRFDEGEQYLLAYACRKESGKWNCNNGKGNTGKWMLMQFNIEETSTWIDNNDIEDYEYVETEINNDEHTGKYEDNGLKVDVIVKKYDSYTQLVSNEKNNFDPTKWTTIEGVCGFLKTGSTTEFTWVSNQYLITVKTFATIVAEEVVERYGEIYDPSCSIINDLGTASLCGNDNKEGAEECDGTDDSACPGRCSETCECVPANIIARGYCGDGTVQRPNGEKPPIMEECEYPTIINKTTGAIIEQGDICMDANFQTGICNEFCQCDTGSLTGGVCGDGIVETNKNGQVEECEFDSQCGIDERCDNCACVDQKCGDGTIDQGEECGEPGLNCLIPLGWNFAGCTGCRCMYRIPGGPICGDGNIDPGEQCDWLRNPTGCAAGQTCNFMCNCVAGAPQPFCGDGNVDPGEQCDDGNNVNGDGCDANCNIEAGAIICGNGIMQAGEECEVNIPCPGNEICHARTCKCFARIDAINESQLNLSIEEYCGNGIIEWNKGEQCEQDSDCYAGEFCTSNCKCVPGLETGDEENNGEDADGETEPYCGDGITQYNIGEQCESDSECYPGEFCSEDCKCIPQMVEQYCGDGVIQESLGEQCESNSDCETGQCIDCECITIDETPTGQFYAVPADKDIIGMHKQYFVFFIAGLAILIITMANFIHFKK